MLHVTMRNMQGNFRKYRGYVSCPHCNSVVWFFRNATVPSSCQYCKHAFIKLFGLINGFMLAKKRYYKYGDE